MKLMKRRKRSGFDPLLGDDDIHQAFEQLEQGDWSLIDALFEHRRDAWVVSWLLHSEHTSIPLERFADWAAAAGSPHSLAHYGRAQVTAAAVRHRDAEGDDAKAKALAYIAALDEAEATLRAAADLDPSRSEPWVGLMATAMGLRLPRADVQERFVQVHAREPFRPDACQQMLKRMCARSGGGHDEMFEFARWLQQESPTDSPCQALLALAHIEFGVSSDGWELEDYLRKPDVAEELKSVMRSYLLGSPEEGPVRHLQALNLVLMAVVPTDKLSGAIVREAVGRIDGRPTALPWGYLDDDIDAAFKATKSQRMKAANKV